MTAPTIPDPTNRVALVTGAASGLGEATARHFHALGHPVVLFDLNAEGLDAVAAALGDRVAGVAGSVIDPDDTQRAVDAAAGLGGLRIAVACAGGGAAASRVVDRKGNPHPLDAFTQTLDLNVVGTFNTLRLAAVAMSGLEPDADGERGAIVLVTSGAAFEGQIGQIAYGSAKSALLGMTLIAARDLSSQGIRVNAVAPGVMDTAGWAQAPEELRDQLAATVPFPHRLGHPHEFARLVQHLVENQYLNGHVARIDGALRFGPR
jgi:NAD(P)-dependent dehydrogenase (short-subunit alcohol dehydrogenase family)